MAKSKIPAVLAELEARLNAVAPTVRALYGRALSFDAVDRLPLIALRLRQDQPVNTLSDQAIVTLTIDIDIFIRASDTKTPDSDLAELARQVRSALAEINETPALRKVMRGGVTWEAAAYGYPESGGDVVMVQQPLTLRITENYGA